jgi:phage terminase large subunit-like protein
MAAPLRYVTAARAYAEGVVSGAIVACKWVRLACQRQLDDLAREPSDEWPWVFDTERAELPCEFIEMLPHIKGKWARERRKITLEGWQAFIVTVVFGWVHAVTGLRRFLEAYIEVPRKNAKSTLTAGLCLFMLSADGEAGAEVYTAATTRDQARIVFDDAKHMAARDADMRACLGIDVLQHALVVEHTASKLAPLAAEGSTLDGLNVHFASIDELHAHKKRSLYDVLETARGAREQALLWAITTAGVDRAGICYERRTYIVKMLEGSIPMDDRQFGIVYTIDEGDDWADPTTWAKANPNLGVSVFPEVLEAACRKALSTPSAVANFLTKHLDVWVNADQAWMDMRAWEACANHSLTLDELKHLPAWVPLDLASKVDVAAGPILFHDPVADRYYLLSKGRFWLPERAVESGTNSQYDGWVRAGHIVATPGEVTDYDVIEDQLRSDARTLGDLREVPFDPFQATQLSGHMLAEGLPMVEMRPTVLNFSEPMKQLEALVLQGPEKFQHDGCPVMTWMVSNVVCHRDAKDNIYPRKERPENKIDGPVAVIMGLGRAMAVPEEEPVPGIINMDLTA